MLHFINRSIATRQDLQKNDQIFQSITADLHSLFELIPGSSDWLCISTFDLISFLVQQLLPILLWPADLADPGSWKESNHMDWPLGGFINPKDIQYVYFQHFL